MTELPNGSTQRFNHPSVLQAADLLRYYSLELDGYPLDQQLSDWLTHYPAKWLQLAVVEALYQGRYKAISVEQILVMWQRRGQPICHFTHDFERLVCSKISDLPADKPAEPSAAQSLPKFQKPTLSYRKMLQQLPSADAASQLDRLTEIPSLKLALLAGEDLSAEFTTERPEDSVEPLTDPGERPKITLPDLSPPLSPVAAATVDGNGMTRSPSTVERDRLNDDDEFRKFKEGVIFALSSSLAVYALHPALRLELSQHYSLDWEKFNLTLAQIEQVI